MYLKISQATNINNVQRRFIHNRTMKVQRGKYTAYHTKTAHEVPEQQDHGIGVGFSYSCYHLCKEDQGYK